MFFEPYEGLLYKDGFRNGRKLLVLGESHYIDGYHPTKNNDPLVGAPFTKEVVERDFLQLGRDSRYKSNSIEGRLHRLLTDSDEPGEQDARAAWSRIAYANYIQMFVGNSASARKRPIHWQSGDSALQGMLEFLAPDRVLIFGKNTWNHIHHGRWLNESWESGGRIRGLWGFTVKDVTVPATWVMHPSWGRDSVTTMREVLAALIVAK
jgi:hypothetical protein